MIDIRTIQTLSGHADVRTTMISTHYVPSRTVKKTKILLDFQQDAEKKYAGGQ
jgi:integrase